MLFDVLKVQDQAKLQDIFISWHLVVITLKSHRGLAGPDCQHIVIDEFLWMVSGCALETDECHWMFKTKANMVQGEGNFPLKMFISKT